MIVERGKAAGDRRRMARRGLRLLRADLGGIERSRPRVSEPGRQTGYLIRQLRMSAPVLSMVIVSKRRRTLLPPSRRKAARTDAYSSE